MGDEGPTFFINLGRGCKFEAVADLAIRSERAQTFLLPEASL
ncbi:unnamed protein product [marine sediment metagenome]|uniref:Uncharacterized protein n=1 Tax=marine sediment metagenome TaxID=412755 RepID=X1QR15_9ZZZZ